MVHKYRIIAAGGEVKEVTANFFYGTLRKFLELRQDCSLTTYHYFSEKIVHHELAQRYYTE